MTKKRVTASQLLQAQAVQMNSRQFSQDATRLSLTLERSEVFFQQLEGKIPVEVEGARYILRFIKVSGTWQLMLQAIGPDGEMDGPKTPVRQATVWEKAEAAKLLPALYEKLKTSLELLRSNVAEALDCLDELPFLPLVSSISTVTRQEGDADDLSS